MRESVSETLVKAEKGVQSGLKKVEEWSGLKVASNGGSKSAA